MIDSDGFSFDVSSGSNGSTVTLIRKKDGKSKVFNLVTHTKPDAIIHHMNSLTNDQCEGFFPVERKPKQQK